MTLVPLDKLPHDLEGLELRREARVVVDAYEAILKHSAFSSNVDLAVLTKLAADEKTPVRERRRAAEALLQFRLRVLNALGEVSGAREQILAQLGLSSGARATATAVAVAQTVTRIEVVRSDDWRGADVADAPPERPDA